MNCFEDPKPLPISRRSLVKYFSNDEIQHTLEAIIVHLYGDIEAVDPGNKLNLEKLAATWHHHSCNPGGPRGETADDILSNLVTPALKKIHAIHLSVIRLGLGVGPADTVPRGDKIAVLQDLGWIMMDMDEFHEQFTQYRSFQYFAESEEKRKMALEELRIKYERSVPEEIKRKLGLHPDRRTSGTEDQAPGLRVMGYRNLALRLGWWKSLAKWLANFNSV